MLSVCVSGKAALGQIKNQTEGIFLNEVLWMCHTVYPGVKQINVKRILMKQEQYNVTQIQRTTLKCLDNKVSAVIRPFGHYNYNVYKHFM